MADLVQLQKALGVEFRDSSLLRAALTHSSYLHENADVAQESNQRLEFLGDAVLGYVIAQELYLRHPAMAEGQLTQARAHLVRSESLAALARRLQLGRNLTMGKGEERSGGATKSRNLASALEAVIGAILLDQGLEAARSFILSHLGEEVLTIGAESSKKDCKSQLQEFVQARLKASPIYRTVEEEGDDGTRVFVAEVSVEGQVVGRGMGPSKRMAQKEAAREALARLEPSVAAPQG